MMSSELIILFLNKWSFHPKDHLFLIWMGCVLWKRNNTLKKKMISEFKFVSYTIGVLGWGVGIGVIVNNLLLCLNKKIFINIK